MVQCQIGAPAGTAVSTGKVLLNQESHPIGVKDVWGALPTNTLGGVVGMNPTLLTLETRRTHKEMVRP